MKFDKIVFSTKAGGDNILCVGCVNFYDKNGQKIAVTKPSASTALSTTGTITIGQKVVNWNATFTDQPNSITYGTHYLVGYEYPKDAPYPYYYGTHAGGTATLTFSQPLDTRDVASMTAVHYNGETYQFKFSMYNGDELVFSYDGEPATKAACWTHNIQLPGPDPVVIVKRNGKYYYRKINYAIDLAISTTKNTSTNGIELYSYTNSSNSKQTITFSKLEVACNANSNHGILDIKVDGEVIKSVENIPSHSGAPTITGYKNGSYANVLPLDTITLNPGQNLQLWGRWAGSHSGVTWCLVGETEATV